MAKGFVEHKARGHKVVFSLYHNKGPCEAKAKCEPNSRILVKLIGLGYGFRINPKPIKPLQLV